jgi:hypothetical protein
VGFVAIQAKRVDEWARESPAPVFDHRRFGAVRGSFHRDSEGLVWECLDLVRTAGGLADLEFEAGAFGPGLIHEQQLDAVIANLGALTRAAARAISEELGRCSKHPLALEWQGARLSGREGAFQLHYWSEIEPEALITVRFEQSRAIGVRFHD